jgi:hypothetical protein
MDVYNRYPALLLCHTYIHLGSQCNRDDEDKYNNEDGEDTIFFH